MMNTYPENDYRTYLEHSSKAHKYISRKRGKGGKWIYTYAPIKKGDGQPLPMYSTKISDSGRIDYKWHGNKRPAENDWIQTVKNAMNTSIKERDRESVKKLDKLLKIFENNSKREKESSSVGILRYKTRSR